MKKNVKKLLTLLVALGFPIVWSGCDDSNGGNKDIGDNVILAFHTMEGVEGGFLGEENSIRGVEGDELPWIVDSAEGALKTDGSLEIHVRGLVFPDDPEVPEELRGINDEPYFRAIVSCLTQNEEDVVSESNVTTSAFAATTSGDGDLETTVTLPSPCIAPIIFIIGYTEEKWFAVTGFDAED